MRGGGRAPSSVEAMLAFTRPDHVAPDREQPERLRAKTLDLDATLHANAHDHQPCLVEDLSAPGAMVPSLARNGFAHVDLGHVKGVPALLDRVRGTGELRDADAAALRRMLRGKTLRMGDGSQLWILHVAGEGMFMRRAGPNAMSIDESIGREGARVVHVDQDVTGTPLRQLLRGFAPRVFRHDSPGRQNRRSPLVIVNIWIPLQQITRPLALLDRTTIDRARHQLRYGLPTDTFLDRAADRKVNDIWTLLHDPAQRWFFTADLKAPRAYAFETLSTAHASFILPGEDRAEALYRRLRSAVAAVEAGDTSALRGATGERRGRDLAAATPSLGAAIDAMVSLLAEAGNDPDALLGAARPSWLRRARSALESVIRTSIELRAVAVTTDRR